MSYIDKNLLPDEQILFRTKKHLIIFTIPFLFLLFAFVTGHYMSTNPILFKVQWAPWLVTLIIWLHALFEYYASDYVVTNKRILMREGFFYRHTNEMRLSAISQVNVYQNLFGQIVDFGTVSIQAFGAFDAFSLIAKPNLFQKYINEQIDKISR